MAPLAFGTQTAGSTIRPAAFCGVIGYKPSFGLINRAGLKFSAESLDTIGLFGRTVADVALFAQALTGLSVAPRPDPADRAASRTVS
jgi:amidase